MMLLLSLPCSHLVVNLSHQIQLFVEMMLGQIFMQGVSGVGDRVHSLILGFFIPTHPAIAILRLLLCFENMNLRKREDMETVSVLSSLLLLHHWFFLLLGVLAGRPPFSTVA